MDFAFFESLTVEEARIFLSRFLEEEKVATEKLVAAAKSAGLSADYNVESLVPLFWWVAGGLKTIPREPDLSLPDWIRNSTSYTENLFDFDNESKIVVLRSAYYLGETFIRSFQGLQWRIGNAETALQNMPVVHGFRHKLEMAPMLVAENLFGRILSGNGGLGDVQKMVSTWVSRTKRA